MGWCVLLNGLLSPAVILQYLLRAIVVLIAIPFHESAHALASHLLGDNTAVRAGRLSLNPMRHFDPLGALCMLVGGVGWAKPVSINPYNYKNPKVGMALSAAAGPASNFLLAWVSMILYKLCWYSGARQAVPALSMFLYYMVAMNLSLGVFNLLPVPPFDGSRIALLFFAAAALLQGDEVRAVYHAGCAGAGIPGPFEHAALDAGQRHVEFDAAPDRLCGTIVGVLSFCRKF